MADTLDPKPTPTTPDPAATPAAAENRELTDDELGKVAGGTGTTLTNLSNMRHETLKNIANNLRG